MCTRTSASILCELKKPSKSIDFQLQDTQTHIEFRLGAIPATRPTRAFRLGSSFVMPSCQSLAVLICSSVSTVGKPSLPWLAPHVMRWGLCARVTTKSKYGCMYLCFSFAYQRFMNNGVRSIMCAWVHPRQRESQERRYRSLCRIRPLVPIYTPSLEPSNKCTRCHISTLPANLTFPFSQQLFPILTRSHIPLHIQSYVPASIVVCELMIESVDLHVYFCCNI
jgi:hypothetical protein